MRTNILDLAKMKREGRRIAVVTAYDYPSAKLAARAGLSVLLVGDSLGMVVLGHETTLPVSVDDMARHAGAVVRGAPNALVIGDLPFLSYSTPEEGVRAAARLMQEAGVQAVKLEGGAPVVPIVRRLTDLGVPVMGHLGYTPQSTHQIGIRVQAKSAAAARTLLEDALALEEAGAFAIVLELVPAPLAAAVTQRLSIPTIGIGAGAGCDGQVQVWHDLLGFYEEKPPRHAKRFGEAGAAIEAALRAYQEEVAAGAFPTGAQSATMPAEALEEALKAIDAP
ncbi:MAG: 3-methyl-2-oxobutanoate hydroxymethyltransferase [Hyphomonadaceae bacterium]